MKKSRIWLATSNKNKVHEAGKILSKYGIQLEHCPSDRIEIQADDLGEIAAYSLSLLKEDRPICIEDAGLFIQYYNGFPGPYSSYVLERLGNPGILKIMEGVNERSAKYISAIAYKDENTMKIFRGEVKGIISESIRGAGGFGYDPIFIPTEGDGRTFGEMEEEEKNSMSHRARAFQLLGEWLSSS